MNAIIKAAVITWLADHNIKLVHVWACEGGYNCMVESPPCGTRAGGLTYPSDQRVGVGVAETPLKALLAALERVGGVTLEFRLHLLGFLVEHLSSRTFPALLRRIE